MGDPGALESVSLRELRVLDGPNLYFTRPAVKLTIDVGPWLGARRSTLDRVARKVGLTESGRGRRAEVRPGAPGTETRRRFVVRMAVHLTRTLARAAGSALAVRGRPGLLLHRWRVPERTADRGR
jgi:cyanophycin synthetase